MAVVEVFAYGSNLCLERIRRRVPSARFIGRARLSGHALRFHKRGRVDGSGKADAFRTGDPADHVWGAVFECAEPQKRVLDRIEGVGSGYDERVVEVEMEDGRRRSVRAYLARPDAIDDGLVPYAWYHRYVVVGAEERGLPADYIAAIREHPTVPDPDRARALENALVPA